MKQRAVVSYVYTHYKTR